MPEKVVKICHTIMENDSFKSAAKDLLKLLSNTQKQKPNKPRM